MQPMDSREPAGQAVPRTMTRRRLVRAALLLGAVPGAVAAGWFSELADGRSASASPGRSARPSSPLVPASAVDPVVPAPAPASLPLAGKIVVIDPGHNPHNPEHIEQIDTLVQAGGFLKACDTCGAETDAGYPEYDFTLDVARRARVILRAAGAKVILTQNGRTVYGPCVGVRAAIGNRAHADASVSIHADGGPPDGYGFAVLAPETIRNAETDNSAIIAPSWRLADVMVKHFGSVTGQNISTYLGTGGIQPRGDLGGMNLSTVPKVFIECANMRNARDAGLVTSPRWRQLAAQGIADSIHAYLIS